MLTIQDILTVKSEMEEEGFIACTDLYIERLRAKEDEKNDLLAKAFEGGSNLKGVFAESDEKDSGMEYEQSREMKDDYFPTV